MESVNGDAAPVLSPEQMSAELAKARLASAARERAEQTPAEVRKAFLARRVRVGEIELHPFTLGILWLLEELESPLMDPTAKGQPMSIKHSARAIFLFARPGEARAALSESVAELDAQAHSLMLQLPVGDIPALSAAIMQITAEGLATVPGAGSGNPPEAPG